MNDFSTFLGLTNIALLLAASIGGFFAFRSGRKQAVVNIQRETIEALQQRLDALESKQRDIEKENDHLKFVIETIKDALSKQHIAVTIDGDMVTISDQAGHATSTKRRSTIVVKPEKKQL